jgi:glycerol-3-phosphate O-acyltransferase
MDVSDYATEATGGAKDKETASWAVAKIMSLRARYGNIHVRFAEPVSVRKELGADGIDEDHLDLRKLAFEVMYRISQVTPITPTAVVSIAILAARTEAVDAAQLTDAAQRVTRAIARSDVPTTEPIHFEDDSVTADILQQLSDHGSLTIDTSTPVRTFRLTPKQAIEAAYYRNTVVHFFVPGAIAEVALLHSDPAAGVEGFWAEVDQLRDLLKFEFFFADKTRFRRDIIEEMDAIDKNWRTRLSEDRESLLLDSDLLRAHWALLPFLEAYLIVATQIATHGYDGDRKQFVSDCLQTGTEWLADGRVSAGESVAKPLFGSALDLALNRGIPDGSVEDRAAFAESVADVVAVAKRVGTLAGGASRLT